MVSAGFAAFALMGYVVANMRPDKTVGFQVELNVPILATIFGESTESIQGAIDYLCAPDPHTRTPTEDGRRLVKIGTFAYRVVNGAAYDAIRNEEDRRAQNRAAQARFRAKKNRRKSTPLAGEALGVKAHNNGDDATFDALAAPQVRDDLPPELQ